MLLTRPAVPGTGWWLCLPPGSRSHIVAAVSVGKGQDRPKRRPSEDERAHAGPGLDLDSDGGCRCRRPWTKTKGKREEWDAEADGPTLDSNTTASTVCTVGSRHTRHEAHGFEDGEALRRADKRTASRIESREGWRRSRTDGVTFLVGGGEGETAGMGRTEEQR